MWTYCGVRHVSEPVVGTPWNVNANGALALELIQELLYGSRQKQRTK